MAEEHVFETSVSDTQQVLVPHQVPRFQAPNEVPQRPSFDCLVLGICPRQK